LKEVAYKQPCGEIFKRMKNLFPYDFDFEPLTFILPNNAFELKDYMKANPGEYFICKPSSGT
jgi:hypothetical protein